MSMLQDHDKTVEVDLSSKSYLNVKKKLIGSKYETSSIKPKSWIASLDLEI